MQSAADKDAFSNLSKLEKLRGKLLVVEKRDYDYRSILQSYNIQGVIDLE